MSQTRKSNFSATCNRLSQYIKERKLPIPENIIGELDINTTVFSQQPTHLDSDATLDLFPGAKLNKTCTSTNPEEKQLTILYNGEVVKFNNMDAEKAEVIFSFASSVTTLKKLVEMDHVSSMPMARRMSLQRFLQKRKDRLSSISAPYSSSNKQALYDDDKSWLQLGLS